MRAGDYVPGVPRHQLKLGADYQLPFGLSVGADLLFNAEQFLRGDESNQLAPVDGFALVNLRGAYQVGDHLQFFARVSNLFDTDYANFGLLGEDPTEVLPNLADASPRFLGVGAPRAGWVGVRVMF